MECPCCKQELKLASNNAFMNADVYRQQNRVLTTCCDQMILITPVRSYRVSPSYSKEIEDDWGNIKKNKQVWFKRDKEKAYH